MANLCTALAAARPVTACFVCITGKSSAIQLRTGQNIVHIGIIAPAVDYLAVFIERCLFVEVIVIPVQVLYVPGHQNAFGIIPGSLSDAVAGIYRFVRA